jgi:NAD(P)-dependent dehydrogenase (short-subunit alcohol dehydrogenase family)
MILITGASRGVGRYLFDRFLESGERVSGTFHASPPSVGHEIHYRKVNVTDFSAVQKWICSYKEESNLTLINCSGISYNAFTHKSDIGNWRAVIDTNLTGTYHCIRAVLPIMRANKWGRIINISSVVAKRPTPGISAYAASKSALWGLSKSVAAENGALGITCNCINLGYAQLGMGVEKVPEAFQAQIKAQIPSGKFCPPEDIFTLVEMLRKVQYINGADIDLSGGLV